VYPARPKTPSLLTTNLVAKQSRSPEAHFALVTFTPTRREAMVDDPPGAAGRLTSVTSPDNRDLILSAAEILNPHLVGDRLFGNVASELIASSGTRYQGVCIDTGSGTGFCAEHSAIAAMVTAGEYRIDKIVAVWRDAGGLLYVLPPCGRCRELVRQVSPANLDTEVVLGLDRSASLGELLPAHDWPLPLDLG
jgi:cytidine deaminase